MEDTYHELFPVFWLLELFIRKQMSVEVVGSIRNRDFE